MAKLESVAWIYKRDGNVLCVKTAGKDKYFLPGGKLDVGETRQLGLLREVKEELDVDLVADTIAYAFTVLDEAYGLKGTDLEMHCYTAEFDGEIVPSSEIECVKWIDKSGIDECAPAAQQVVLRVLR